MSPLAHVAVIGAVLSSAIGLAALIASAPDVTVIATAAGAVWLAIAWFIDDQEQEREVRV